MIRSRIFVFWAIAMFFAAYLCASAAENTNEKEKTEKEAKDAVEALEALTQKALQNATKSLREANSIRSRVQSHRASAQNAILQMRKVPNGNTKAEAIAKEVTTEAKKVITLHTAALKAADDAVNSMAGMVTKAKALVTDAYIETELDSEDTEDTESDINYTEVNRKVAEVNANVLIFQTEMKEKATILPVASALELEMSALVDKIKVGKYHFSVTLSVSQIDIVLKKADVDIGKTENKRDEVNETLKEMIEISKKAPESSAIYVNSMIQNAEGALGTASRAVTDAKKVKEEMMKIKMNADASLEKFKDATNPDNVEEEVQNTKEYARDVASKAPQIAKELQAANITATNAESRKQSFIRVLSSSNTQPSIGNNKVPSKPGKPLSDGDSTIVKKEKKSLSTTNTESNTQDLVQTLLKQSTQPGIKETKDSEQTLNSATDDPQNVLKVNPPIINSENTVSETSENSMQQASKEMKIDTRELQKVKNTNTLKDNFQKATKNGTKITLVDENLSALSPFGDSSMLVSVPLLAALIVSAVLH